MNSGSLHIITDVSRIGMDRTMESVASNKKNLVERKREKSDAEK